MYVPLFVDSCNISFVKDEVVLPLSSALAYNGTNNSNQGIIHFGSMQIMWNILHPYIQFLSCCTRVTRIEITQIHSYKGICKVSVSNFSCSNRNAHVLRQYSKWISLKRNHQFTTHCFTHINHLKPAVLSCCIWVT